jgi:uncharacterized protein YbjT (DUF2867 family)
VSGRTALVAGSTGLVGQELLRQLAAAPGYDRVSALTRRPLGASHGDRVREVTVDFERLEAASDALAADHVYCALGTTSREFTRAPRAVPGPSQPLAPGDRTH